jgi:proteasome accessory factor A
VVAASWDSVIFDVQGRPALQRVPLLDPLRGTREQVGQMIDSCKHRRGPLSRFWAAKG